MAFWDFFNLGNNSQTTKLAGLPQKLAAKLPDLDDQAHAKIAAISGLLACVAQTDFHVSEAEQSEIEKSLLTWCQLTPEQAKTIAQLAIDEVAALASLEVFKYTETLDNILNDEERVGVLEALFQLAAVDESVGNDESEFIRHVAHGLRLDHREFIAARATVIKHLSILKNS